MEHARVRHSVAVLKYAHKTARKYLIAGSTAHATQKSALYSPLTILRSWLWSCLKISRQQPQDNPRKTILSGSRLRFKPRTSRTRARIVATALTL
jgi:hypothetical protein